MTSDISQRVQDFQECLETVYIESEKSRENCLPYHSLSVELP